MQGPPTARRTAPRGDRRLGRAAAGPGLFVAAALSATAPHQAHADEPTSGSHPPRQPLVQESLIRFQFRPVGGLQIALWVETPDGTHLRDVFVTQSVGRLGIGNRSGRWDFLSSWRFPYGPRINVLPVWAHRRGKLYPKVVFHEDDEEYWDSLGWHESTSSAEPYFCRPLTAEEDAAIIDVMSCPSPGGFSSDKGRFAAQGATSLYPPRGDLTAFDPDRDHEDIKQFDELNDLDAITGATPLDGQIVTKTLKLRPTDFVGESLVAWIEVNLEHDENSHWDFDRETDHFVDPKLATYGVEWRGQPSVLYRVEFTPGVAGIASVESYAGYSDETGTTGTLFPPDSTISTAGGSGADRLSPFSVNDTLGRFFVTSTEWGASSTTCVAEPPPAEDLALRARAFDRVDVELTVPEALVSDDAVASIRLYVLNSTQALTETTKNKATLREFVVCATGQVSGCDVDLGSDGHVSLEVDQLFGDYTYQIGATYTDVCGTESPLVAGTISTPTQEFQVIDTFCVIATAAWGANWTDEVTVLRSVRDRYLRDHPLGGAFIATYYAYGPFVANIIARDAGLRALTRKLLRPIVDLATSTVR